jgi:hypothetical protein
MHLQPLASTVPALWRMTRPGTASIRPYLRCDCRLLSDGLPLNAFAAGDSRFRDTVTANAVAFGGWVMVKAKDLTSKPQLSAIDAAGRRARRNPVILTT